MTTDEKLYHPDEVLYELRAANTEVLLSVQAMLNPAEIDGIPPADIAANAARKLVADVETLSTWATRATKLLKDAASDHAALALTMADDNAAWARTLADASAEFTRLQRALIVAHAQDRKLWLVINVIASLAAVAALVIR